PVALGGRAASAVGVPASPAGGARSHLWTSHPSPPLWSGSPRSPRLVEIWCSCRDLVAHGQISTRTPDLDEPPHRGTRSQGAAAAPPPTAVRLPPPEIWCPCPVARRDLVFASRSEIGRAHV